MSGAEQKRCNEIAPLLVFYVWDEVTEAERKRIQAHLAACAECARQLEEERAFSEVVLAAPQAADQLDAGGVLLAQCRSELAEALDEIAAEPAKARWQPFGWMRRWMALHPAWSGAALVLFGAVMGVEVLPVLRATAQFENGPAVNVSAGPRITNEELAHLAVAGVNFAPGGDSGGGTVQLRLSAAQPMVLSGNVQDSDVRRVLTYVVSNGERFDPGVRLDCLDALGAAARDQEVRKALLTAARKDPVPAVRMKALEALRDSSDDDAVRNTLLDVLEHDDNPGVRVEAINLLVNSLGHDAQERKSFPALDMNSLPADASVERALRMLGALQQHDPNRYVRLRSAAALRQIGPREVQ